jgi:hypothetical protein
MACIFTPMALTIASLICIILVGMGSTNSHSDTLSNLYFFGADTSGFKTDTDLLQGIPGDDPLNSLLSSKGNQTLEDFYTVGLWNYCSGKKTGNDTYDLTFCSPSVAAYWFNPVEVWGLENSGLEAKFPSKLQDGLNAYHAVSKWMFIAYVVAFFATIAELVVGIFAIWSRWGSFATTIISCVSGIFIFLAALTSTITFAVLAGAFDSVLKSYDIKAVVGKSMLTTTWLAVAFSWAAGIFWLMSVCCCSGRSNSPANRPTRAEKTPYTYERVASPFGAPGGAAAAGNRTSDVPLKPMQYNEPYKQNAYEPYRHENV